MNVDLFSWIVSVMVIIGQVTTVVLALLLMRDFRARSRNGLTTWIHKNGLWLAFLVTFGAVAASFVYSNIIGYPPCDLCWYQRAFWIPLVFMLGIAAWKKDRAIIPYAMTLVGVGALIALDHIWLQSGGSSLIPCSSTGIGCAQRFVYEFGYITIPVMSLTGFAFVGALLGHAQVRKG